MNCVVTAQMVCHCACINSLLTDWLHWFEMSVCLTVYTVFCADLAAFLCGPFALIPFFVFLRVLQESGTFG